LFAFEMRRDFYGATPTKSTNKNTPHQKIPSSLQSTPALQKHLFSNEKSKSNSKQQENNFLSSSFDSQLIIASPSDHRFRHFHYTTTSEDSELNHLLNDYDPFPSSSTLERKRESSTSKKEREIVIRSLSPPPPPPLISSTIPSRASSPSMISLVTDLDFNDQLEEEREGEQEDWKDSLALSSLLKSQKQHQQQQKDFLSTSLSHQQQRTKQAYSSSQRKVSSPSSHERSSKNKSHFLLDDEESQQVQRHYKSEDKEEGEKDESPTANKLTSQSFYRKMEQLKKTTAFGGNEKHVFPSSLSSPKLSPTPTAAAVSLFSASLSPNASFSSASFSPRYQDPSLLLNQFKPQQPQPSSSDPSTTVTGNLKNSSSFVLSPSSSHNKNKISFQREEEEEDNPFLKYDELLQDLPSSSHVIASSSAATSPTATAGGEGENMDILGLKLLLKTALREKHDLVQDKRLLQEENKNLIYENSILF
jgi:hypothetical protein